MGLVTLYFACVLRNSEKVIARLKIYVNGKLVRKKEGED